MLQFIKVYFVKMFQMRILKLSRYTVVEMYTSSKVDSLDHGASVPSKADCDDVNITANP